MDAEVILCPCGPFIAFKLLCLYSCHTSFFFFVCQHHFGPQKLLLMHFIPGALTVHWASPEKRISEAGTEDCAQTIGNGNSFLLESQVVGLVVGKSCFCFNVKLKRIIKMYDAQWRLLRCCFFSVWFEHKKCIFSICRL